MPQTANRFKPRAFLLWADIKPPMSCRHGPKLHPWFYNKWIFTKKWTMIKWLLFVVVILVTEMIITDVTNMVNRNMYVFIWIKDYADDITSCLSYPILFSVSLITVFSLMWKCLQAFIISKQKPHLIDITGLFTSSQSLINYEACIQDEYK